MKSILPFIAAILLCYSSIAQSSVQLNIDHKLGDEIFTFNTTTTNNLGNPFNVNRLDYYISEISIIHDGGIETQVEDKYILVDASRGTLEDLGTFNINEVEAIRFHVGVDSVNNHSDPALYPSEHPLAPKFPAMHWGWAAGYRFIAFEGQSGDDMNQEYQLHGLGDINYFMTEVPVSASVDNDNISIQLEADYTRILEDIDVSSGLIVHGQGGAAQQAIMNFRDHVYSAALTSTAFAEEAVAEFEVFPNPTYDSEVAIRISATDDDNYQLSISDAIGRQIQLIDQINDQEFIHVNLERSGMYYVSLIKANRAVITKKLLVY
jgi:hypothetical protein